MEQRKWGQIEIGLLNIHSYIIITHIVNTYRQTWQTLLRLLAAECLSILCLNYEKISKQEFVLCSTLE